MLYFVLVTLVAVITAIGAYLFRGRKELARHDDFRSKSYSLHVGAIGAALVLVLTFSFSVVTVDNGHVAVEKRFGRTVESAYTSGIHFLAPWSTTVHYDALRREFPFVGDVIAKDNNPLSVEAGFATKLNPDLAWRMQTTVGTNYFEGLVQRAGMTAVRDGISQFGWTTAVTSDRGQVQVAIQDHFKRILQEQMVAAGMTPDEALRALEISPVQLRKALPDQKVSNAVAEKTAALQDLERQETLTKIAEEEANRRLNEGTGVSNLFTSLPQGFTSQEISLVLGAMADKTRADAMLKAVESGQVRTVIMNGDTAGNVSHMAEPVTVRAPVQPVQ